jgi:hypothetical protein
VAPQRDDSPWFDDDLAALESHCWAALTRGKHKPREPFHWPTVSTHDPERGPTSRTVVLRHVDRDALTLHLHTDLRSDKIAHLRADPRHAWHFFDGKKVQLRARAAAALHHDDALADDAWSRLSPGSRRTYCSSDPGGKRDQPDTGLPQGWFDTQLTAEDVARGRANFCVVAARVLEFELLYLSRAGHRRALFTYDGDSVASTWLVP